MKVTSVKFIKSIVGPDEILESKTPQVAFIGRSNVGKSSTINAVTAQKGLARTSSFPGRTQQINVFHIDKSWYLLDLPGYGFAKASLETRRQLENLIFWYLFDSPYEPKAIVLIIDANIGLTQQDLEMLNVLEKHQKNIIIAANKIDKLKSSETHQQLRKIQGQATKHKIILYSAEKKIGIDRLLNEIFNS